MIPRLPFVAVFLICAWSPAAVAAPDDRVAEAIDAYLAAHHDLGQFSGAALVAEEGEVVYEGAFGLANADWGIANDPETKFRLASVTKQFTAMLVLQLVQDGRLELDAPIIEYLPDYPAESGSKVTIHHLLNHTSGIPSYTDRPDFFQKHALLHRSVDEFVAELCSDPLEFEPGTAFHYNNSGYFLLGAIVEAVTEKPYRTALRERIFDPLGMTSTGYDDQYAVLTKRATGYDMLLGKHRLSRWMDMSTPYSAGALYSTVGDLWKWEQAVCARTLLSEELTKRMFTADKQGYGYGWKVYGTVGGRGADALVTWHSGRMPGVSAQITRVPLRGRCIILLSNQSGAAVDEAVRGILGILDGRPPGPPTLRPGMLLATTILDEGVDAALATLVELPPAEADDAFEQELNQLGYLLLGQDRINEALQLMTFNTQAFANSANAWDSLGEVQLKAGERELAIESYRAALEVDPAFENAKAMLERLAP